MAAAQDLFSAEAVNLRDPATRAFVIMPAEADLPFVTRSIYVGSGGELDVIMASGDRVIFSLVPSGIILPIRVRRVGVSTSAGCIIGLL